jgi:hypothetical protein
MSAPKSEGIKKDKICKACNVFSDETGLFLPLTTRFISIDQSSKTIQNLLKGTKFKDLMKKKDPSTILVFFTHSKISIIFII